MMDFKAFFLISAVLVVSLLPLMTVYGEEVLSFQVIQPTGNIYVGDQVQLQCVFSGFIDNNDAILIFQRIGNNDIRTLATHEGRYFNAPPNIHSSGIQDNSIVSVTINDIDVSFSGDFTCYIAKIAGAVLDQQHLKLDVLLRPPPSCSVTPLDDDLIFNDMDDIRLTCISDNPQSILFWNLQSQIAITLPQADTTSSSDIVTSTFDLTLTLNYDGTTFTCLRESDRETCTIGPLKVRSGLLTTVMTEVINTANTNSTDDPAASTGLQGGNIGAIVGGVLCIIIFLIIVIIVVFWLVRSGKLDSLRNRKESTSKSREKLEIMHVNGSETTIVENGNSNPANVPHVLSPNGGQVYAVVQKNKPQEEARVPDMPKSTVKDYPKPPSYPRPAKRRESEEQGEHYANAGLLVVNSADKNTERKRSSIPREIRVASSPKNSISIDDSNTVVYANASDVGVGNVNRKSSSSSNRMSGDNQSDQIVYANASEAIAGGPISPAPTLPPPAPPGSPGLEYADLDLIRPPSVGTSNSGVISSDDPVMYASVTS